MVITIGNLYQNNLLIREDLILVVIMVGMTITVPGKETLIVILIIVLDSVQMSTKSHPKQRSLSRIYHSTSMMQT
jgi:hypothetical protein